MISSKVTHLLKYTVVCLLFFMYYSHYFAYCITLLLNGVHFSHQIMKLKSEKSGDYLEGDNDILQLQKSVGQCV